MNLTKDQLTNVPLEARAFRNQFQTLHLATSTADGSPMASYTPFVQLEENQFSIYVSELSAHTQNLIANPRASILFIEPEENIKQAFARRRLVYSCQVERVARDSEQFNNVITEMKDKFNGIMQVLESLKDFHAFTLIAKQATYIKGFAQAYEFADGYLDAGSLIPDNKRDSDK